MHGHVDHATFLQQISSFLGFYYIALAAMNGIAALAIWRGGRSKTLFRVGPLTFTNALLWTVVAFCFLLMAPLAMSGSEPLMRWVSMPDAFKHAADAVMGPVAYSLGSFLVLAVLFSFRKFFVRTWVAWLGLNLAFLFMGLSITDPDFAAIVTKPDNVPIVGLIFLLGFFTWLATAKAVKNDERIARGEKPLEAVDNEKILVWPDLVYTELICMVALTALLLLWGIALQAPLEEPASSVKTPNPSKAPWYFLGLQEMLVYYDPWMAGVVLPSVVIVGLMAIPYIDFNRRGNGYYTINERKFAYVIFQFGFLVLWVTLIVMGTFLRGPNWNFFGFYETWDVHKVVPMNNVDLSEYFWIRGLGREMPKAPEGSGAGLELLYILWREAPGIILLIGYFTLIPPAMVIYSKFFRNMYLKMGLIRFMVMSHLLLLMGLLPIKMVCRWSFDLKYFIAIKEYFLNF